MKTITIRDASIISGLSPVTLRSAAQEGRLKAERHGGVWLTTDVDLHNFLLARGGSQGKGPVKGLPEGYQAPEGGNNP